MTFQAPSMNGGLPLPAHRDGAFRRGLVIGPLTAPESDDDFKRKHVRLLERAVALGVTDVQLVVRWLTVDYSATEVAPFDTVHDELLTWLVDAARKRKMRVFLTPQLEVEGEGPHSAAGLEPKSWDLWWWSYQRMALHYARFAHYRKVHSLSLGYELGSTEGQTERWRKLVQDARKIYKGELTYVAAPEGLERVGFWQELDFVGVAIDQAQPRSEEQLAEKLAPTLEQLHASKRLREHAYVISEAGCGRGDPDDARELLCQYSLFQSFRDEPKLAGAFLQPSVTLAQGAKYAEGASEVVSHWYKKSH